VQCDHYDAGRCGSCTLLATPYPTQVRDKAAHVASLLPDAGIDWLPPVTGPESGFRNKAKMVVSGTVDAPVLGILGAAGGPVAGQGVDLTDCGLYPPALQASFGPLAAFVTRAGLHPYDAVSPSRGRRRRETPRESAWRGELKHVLVTMSADGELMVRLVLRSTEPVARIRKHLPWLRAELPQAAVVSVNVQPAHAAVIEGAEEIVLTERETLPMRLHGITLHLRPQSFFQTNTAVAGALYDQARAWVDDVAPASLWDLYCGVGGFALHCAAPGRTVTGIEISPEAVAGATATRDELASLPAGAVVGGLVIGVAVPFTAGYQDELSFLGRGLSEVVPYIVAQLIGGAVGALLIVAAFGTGAVDLAAVGSTTLADGVGYGQGIVAEVIGTYILVLAIMAVAVDPRAPAGWSGWMIGLAVACAILLIGPLTGGSLNPARTFGPYFAAAVFGGDVPWRQFPLYWIGPLIGGALASLSYDLLARPEAAEPAATEEPAAAEEPDTAGERDED
jgi:23S rRNA (uracil747-C5)-methyltransferase